MNTDLGRAVRAEVYKLKHNSILITALVLPGTIAVVMNLILPIISNGRPFTSGNAWVSTTIGLLQVWGFIQAFIVAVVTAQMAGLEHQNNRWKYLFALPVSRKAMYLAKGVVSLGLFGLSSVVILIGLIVTGLLLNIIKPDMGFGAAIPIGDMLSIVIVNYVASWLLIAIQVWAGMNWSNFGPAVGMAMVAFLLNTFLVPYPNILRVFPWALPTNFFVTGMNVTGELLKGDVMLTSIIISVAGAVVVLVVGAWHVTRRDVL